MCFYDSVTILSFQPYAFNNNNANVLLSAWCDMNRNVLVLSLYIYALETSVVKFYLYVIHRLNSMIIAMRRTLVIYMYTVVCKNKDNSVSS